MSSRGGRAHGRCRENETRRRCQDWLISILAELWVPPFQKNASRRASPARKGTLQTTSPDSLHGTPRVHPYSQGSPALRLHGPHPAPPGPSNARGHIRTFRGSAKRWVPWHVLLELAVVVGILHTSMKRYATPLEGLLLLLCDVQMLLQGALLEVPPWLCGTSLMAPGGTERHHWPGGGR